MVQEVKGEAKLAPWGRNPEKLIIVQVVKRCLSFYGTLSCLQDPDLGVLVHTLRNCQDSF
jgi:hypothetical protein